MFILQIIQLKYSFSWFSWCFIFFSSTIIHESQDSGERGDNFFNSSLPLPSTSQTLIISREIIAESSPLHIAGDQSRTGNPWFPSVNLYQAIIRFARDKCNNHIPEISNPFPLLAASQT